MLKHKMKVITLVHNSNENVPHIVSADGVVKAAFVIENDAINYKKTLEAFEEINCCAMSRATRGWSHDGCCPNWVMVY